MPPFLFILVLSVLWVGKVLGFEEALDGKVNKLIFTNLNNEIVYHYTPIDKDATLSVMVYPDVENNASIQSSICLTENCERVEVSYRDFYSVDIPVYREIFAGEGEIIDLRDTGVYVKIEGSLGARINLVIMSSIILEDNKTIKITEQDDYDYIANNYMRYYRLFACNNSEGSINLGNNQLGYAIAYLHGWNELGVEEPGRPSENDHTRKITAFGKITGITNAIYPGWIFIGINVKNLFESGGDYIEITPNIVQPIPITNDDELDIDLCLYEGCTKSIVFNPAYIDFDIKDVTLSFLAMINEKYPHEGTGLFKIEVGDSYPVSDSKKFHKLGNNMVIFDEVELGLLKQLQEVYFSISMVNPYMFPQQIPIGETVNIIVTFMKNAEVISVGRKSSYVTLERSVQDENCIRDMVVDYRRLALDSLGLNEPYYASNAGDDNLPPIVCDYIVVAKPTSYTIDPDLHLGVYIGPGNACVPYTADYENIYYMFGSKNVKVNEQNKEDEEIITILTIPSSSENYHQDGAYILDIYNDNIDQSVNPGEIITEIAAHPSWRLRKNTQYNMYLNGSSRYDFFVIELDDISRGFTFNVETTYSYYNTVVFNLYVSLANGTPSPNSRFSKQGYGRVSINLTPEDLSELEESGYYKLYVAIDTLFKGEVLMYYTEGAGIQYHIADSEDVNVSLTPEAPTSTVSVHLSSSISQREILFYYDATDNDWIDGASIDLCVSTTSITQLSDCKRGSIVSLRKDNRKMTTKIPAESTGNGSPDYFIFIAAKYPQTGENPMKVKVYASKMGTMSLTEVNYLENQILPLPTLMYFQTKLDQDYTMNFNIRGFENSGAKYQIRICADYPSISISEPPDVDADNKRLCVSYRLIAGQELSFDLIGDSLLNESTVTNDIAFIRSIHKYVTIYPISHIPNSTILSIVYEDGHLDANSSDQALWGVYDATSYLRLHIISADTVHVDDLLNFSFEGANPVDYCVSRKPHVEMNKENCIKYHFSNSVEEQESDIHEIIRLADIDPNYDAKHDVYVYFSYTMPAAIEDTNNSLLTVFSNFVVHYLDIIKSPNDDLDIKSYFFELYPDKVAAFYTSNIDIGKPLKFILSPYVVTNDFISGAYSNAEVIIKSTTTIGTALPIPTDLDYDIKASGIVIKEYTLNEGDFIDDDVHFIIIVKFTEFIYHHGLYKAGFIGFSEESEHNLANITIIQPEEVYTFSNDNMSGTTPTPYLKSKLFYYPHATSDTAIKVYPCAGAPGIYQSYLNVLPEISGEYVSSFPTYGYRVGKPFKATFFDWEYDDIGAPTGFIINATAYAAAFYNDKDPYNKLRWDAELRLVNNFEYQYPDGPYITNSAIHVVNQKGSEVTVEIHEAMSGALDTQDDSSDFVIEYSLFAIPAVDENHIVEYFDASPDSHCGLMKFGIPLMVDSSNNVNWVKGNYNHGSDDDNSNPDTIKPMLKLISNVKPSKYEYPPEVRPNYYNPNEDSSLSGDQKDEAGSLYNINVLVREVFRPKDGDEHVLGYSSYSHVQLKISGSLPVSEGGLFGWEIALIVIACVIVVGAIIGVVIWRMKKKRDSMGYQDVDGQGAPRTAEDKDEESLNLQD